MVVAGTEVKLGVLRACDLGCVLVQQLVSNKDAGRRRDAILSMKRIEKPDTAEDLRYKVHLDSEHMYISWAPFLWWEKYALRSLDTLMQKTLYNVSPNVLRPKPDPAWIRKKRPTVTMNLIHQLPSPSPDVATGSTTLVKPFIDEPSASYHLAKKTYGDVPMAKRDSLGTFELYKTAPLPSLDEAATREGGHLWGNMCGWTFHLSRTFCLS